MKVKRVLGYEAKVKFQPVQCCPAWDGRSKRTAGGTARCQPEESRQVNKGRQAIRVQVSREAGSERQTGRTPETVKEREAKTIRVQLEQRIKNEQSVTKSNLAS